MILTTMQNYEFMGFLRFDWLMVSFPAGRDAAAAYT
jgi:hypothetical protein